MSSHAGVVTFADGCREFLVHAAAADTDFHSVVRRQFRNYPIEFANTGDVFTIDAKDDVILAQAGPLGRTVPNYLGHADAANLVQAVVAHVFAADVFGINTEERAFY